MAKSNRSTVNAPSPSAAERPASLRAAARPASAARKRAWWRRRPERINHAALLVALTGVVILAVAAILGIAYWDTYIRPAHQPAVRVGGHTDNMAYLVRRMKLVFNTPAAATISAAQIAQLPQQLGDQILDEDVLLQRAGSLGVTVSDSQIDEYLAEQLAVPFTRNDQGNVQHSTGLENGVRARLRGTGLSLAEYRRALHGDLLQQEVTTYFQNALPEAVPAARIRVITVADEAKAKDIKQQLDGGTDFAQLAASESQDTATKANGGLIDWTPVELLPADLRDAVSKLAPGQVSDPIKVGNQYEIVKVDDKNETHQLTDTERPQLARQRFNDWMTKQRQDLNAKSYMDDKDRQNYALGHSDAVAVAARNSSSSPGQQTAPVTIPVAPAGGGLPSSMPGGAPAGAAPVGGAAPAGGGAP